MIPHWSPRDSSCVCLCQDWSDASVRTVVSAQTHASPISATAHHSSLDHSVNHVSDRSMLCYHTEADTKWTPFHRRHFQGHFLECWIPIKISLKFVPKSAVDNFSAVVQIMAWRHPGDKPLSEPIIVTLPNYICVTRPQWDWYKFYLQPLRNVYFEVAAIIEIAPVYLLSELCFVIQILPFNHWRNILFWRQTSHWNRPSHQPVIIVFVLTASYSTPIMSTHHFWSAFIIRNILCDASTR